MSARGAMVQKKDVEALVGALRAFLKDILPRGSVLDVVGWTPRNSAVSLAMVGDAERLYRAVGSGQNVFRNWKRTSRDDYGLMDERLSKAFGFEPLRLFHSFDWDSKDRVDKGSLFGLLEGVEYAAREWLGRNMGKDAYGWSVTATLIPVPGYPWYGKGSEFFSSAKGKWISPAEPSWRGEDVDYPDPDTGRNVKTPSANWCQLMGGIGGASEVAVASVNGNELIATHSFGLERRMSAEKAAASLKGCGGFLFPSVAVGKVPASEFGPCSLVVDASLILRSLKPYRGRGERAPFAVFSTDFWTETTGNLFGSLAAELYQELTGDTDSMRWAQAHPPYMMGPVRVEDYSVVEGAKVLSTISGLKTAAKRRFAIWKRDLTLKKYNALKYELLGARVANRWPFMEAKGLGVLKPSAFVAAVVPQDQADKYAAFLAEIGLTCPIIPLARSTEERHAFFDFDDATENSSVTAETRDYITYRYSWRVADAIRDAVKAGILVGRDYYA